MNWPLMPLGEVAEVSWGNTSITKASYTETGFSAFSATGNDGLLAEYEFDGDGIVLSAIGARCGRCFKASGKWTAIKNTITITQKQNTPIDLNYFFYYLNKESIWPQRGGAQPFISLGDARKVQIPFPPLEEQKRIATILNKADAIRKKRQQAIDLTDQLLSSVFLDMFGDPGFNQKQYRELTLGEIKKGKMNNGIFRKNNEYGGAVPVAWVGELFAGSQIDLSESRCVEPTEKERKSYGLKYGDILFCRSSLKLEGIGWNNVYLGKDNKALFECHLIRMSPNPELVNPIFLNYQLRLPNIRKRIFQQAKTVTLTTIDQDGISNVQVMVPPIDEQNKFAEFFIALNDRAQKKDSSLELADNLFNALNQKAFSGELSKSTKAA